jgi:hypothetical protein
MTTRSNAPRETLATQDETAVIELPQVSRLNLVEAQGPATGPRFRRGTFDVDSIDAARHPVDLQRGNAGFLAQQGQQRYATVRAIGLDRPDGVTGMTRHLDVNKPHLTGPERGG